MRNGSPRRPAVEVTLMMAPPPALIISGTAKRMHMYELVRQELTV